MEEKYFSCEVHKERFKTISDLKQHVEQYHQPEKKQFECSICKKNFKTEFHYQRHIKKHATVIKSNAKDLEVLGPVVTIKYEETAVKVEAVEAPHFQCHICSNWFVGESTLSQHLLSHVQDKDRASFNSSPTKEPLIKTETILEESETNELLEDSDQTNSNDGNYEPDDDFDSSGEDEMYQIKTRQPAVVGKKAIFEQMNDQNSLTKLPKKKSWNFGKHVCYFCSKSWMFRRELTRHMWTHTGERPCICPVCFKTYRETTDLNRHIMLLHNGIKVPPPSYTCRYCPMSFSKTGELSIHMLKHPERVFLAQCSVCEKTYHHVNDLYHHVNEAHGITPTISLKPYCCSVCKKYFKDKNTISKHMVTHSEQRLHKCPQCPKTYKRAGTLGVHLRTFHSKTRSFKCEFCFKTYNRNDVLLSHKRTYHKT